MLPAYGEWGDALRRALQRHVGVRALGRRRERRLFCSRDRFGVKPFYYRFDDGRLVFASELKAFRADPPTTLRPNLPRSSATTSSKGCVRPPRRDVLRRNPQAAARAHARLRPGGAADAAATGSSSCGTAGRRLGRSGARALPRLRPAAPAQRRPGRHLPLGRGRLVRDRVRGRPAARDGDRERAAGRRPAANVHRVLRGSRASTSGRSRSRSSQRRRPTPHWVSFNDEDIVDEPPGDRQAQDEPFGSTSIVAQWYLMREAARGRA